MYPPDGPAPAPPLSKQWRLSIAALGIQTSGGTRFNSSKAPLYTQSSIPERAAGPTLPESDRITTVPFFGLGAACRAQK